MNDKAKLFENVVGQERAKNTLRFYIDSYQQTHLMPHMIFVAARGQGKTTLGRETARGLTLFDADGKIVMNEETKRPRKKTYIEINCATLRNIKAFFNAVVIPLIQDKDVTVLFDEASSIPADITMALLTILNPNPENRTTFSFDEYTVDFDFRRQTFLFATTEGQKIFHALLDRLERIDLEDYTFEQLGRIVQKGVPQVKFEGEALEQVSMVLRGNARAAQKMASKIATYLRGTTKFTMKHWQDMVSTLGILPLGLNNTELHILRILANHPEGTSLTALSAKTQLSRESVQRDYEMYLQKHSLMEIATTGRIITPKGQEYLKSVDSDSRFCHQGMDQ